MAVKNILIFVDNIYDGLCGELESLTKQMAMFSDFINSDVSEYSPDVMKLLKEKYGPKDSETYIALAKKEFAGMVYKVKSKQSKMNFWSNIRDHIKNSEDGYVYEELAVALKGIESVPDDSGLFGRKIPFGKKLKQKQKKILTSSNELKANNEMPKVDPEFVKDLELVHEKLMRVYALEVAQRDKIIWQYSYNEEIKNKVLKQWLEEAMTLNQPGSSLSDVQRGINIPGNVYGEKITQEQYGQLITNMLNQATSYNSDEKQLLASWIDANGNQKKLTRFADLLFNENEFTDPIQSNDSSSSVPPYGMTIQKKLDQSWYVENGKVYFEYEVLALLVQGEKTLYMDPEAYAKGKNDCFVYGKIKNKEMDTIINDKESLPPVARIRGRFYLEIDKQKQCVKPVMEELLATSYTSCLKNPERLYGPGASIEPKMTHHFTRK